MDERKKGRRPYNAEEAKLALKKAQDGWTVEAVEHLRQSGAPREERRKIIPIVRHQIAKRKEGIARQYRKEPHSETSRALADSFSAEARRHRRKNQRLRGF